MVIDGRPKSVAAKILAVMQDVEYIRKDGRNKAQKYNYLSEKELVTRVRESMIRHKLIVIPSGTEYDIQLLDRVPDYEGKPKNPMALTTVAVTYTIMCTETGQSIPSTQFGQGTDSLDKGMYKALTGCNKYFLMKLFQIPTGDDPEAPTKEEQEEATQQADAVAAALEANKTRKYYEAVEGLLATVPDNEAAGILAALGGQHSTWMDIPSGQPRMDFFNKLKEAIKEKEKA